MLKQIPQSRVLIYGSILGFLPLLISFLYFFSEKSSLTLLQERMIHIKEKSYVFEKKQAPNKNILNHFKNADHFYIDKHLESLTFLQREVESLEKLSSNKNYAFDDSINKRLDFLNNENQLAFTEGAVQKNQLFQETIETLNHPVEVDTNDIQKILSRIEGVKLGDFSPIENCPQFIILDFKIERKTHLENNDNYLLNIKLLKREFL